MSRRALRSALEESISIISSCMWGVGGGVTVICEPRRVFLDECLVRVDISGEVYFKEIVCRVLFFFELLYFWERYEVLEVENVG